MVSIGGLDVAYGAQMQLVRTNVLCVKADTADFTAADAKTLHNLSVQRFHPTLKPDYTFCFTGSVSAGSEPSTAFASALTDDVEGGLLKAISKTPIAGGNGHGTWTSATDNEYRGMSIESILQVAAINIKDAATSTAEELFTTTEDGTYTNSVLDADFAGGSTLMADVMADAMNTYSVSGEARHLPNPWLDLSTALSQITYAGSVTDTEVDTLTDASEAATTAGSTLTELKAVLDEGAALISVMALCKNW